MQARVISGKAIIKEKSAAVLRSRPKKMPPEIVEPEHLHIEWRIVRQHSHWVVIDLYAFFYRFHYDTIVLVSYYPVELT